jgi:hypothetical protein
LKIFCFGKSEARQKARCEFFVGAGCNAEWTTDMDAAIRNLTRGRYDAIILGPTVSTTERDYITQQANLLCPTASVFTITSCPTDPSDEIDYVVELPAILFKLLDLHDHRRA